MGELREVYSWDYGNRLGAIPQPPYTYNVVGNTNEHQLTIGETTFGGLEILDGTNGQAVCNGTYGCVDYGSLIWITLQRAKTAREAIQQMDHLMQTYGYASTGESFAIADPYEVWLMEVIGKGNFTQGAVWVATRIPDGHVSSTANQARTTTFARGDPENVLYSQDVVDFARSISAYSGSDEDFSFSDVYNPVDFFGARYCEARVFSFFVAVAAPSEQMEQYLSYAQGYNLTNRMPLFVKVGKKLSVNDTMWHMRNHYEGTWLDPRGDVGAEAWHSPMRLGEGLQWRVGSQAYVNERVIGTQYAGWNFVGVQRPNKRYSVLWFGVDDSTFSLHTPIYGAASRIPPAWDGADCNGRTVCRLEHHLIGSIKDFNFGSMHWVTNMVANYAYSRYDQIAPVVKSKLAELEGDLFAQVEAMDSKLEAQPWLRGSQATGDPAQQATEFSYNTAKELHEAWLQFYGELFATFVDGYKMTPDPDNLYSGVRKVTPHWTETWKETVANATGTHYMVPGTGGECVDADGRLTPCPVSVQPRAVIGGSKEQTPLANVPRSRMRAFRGLGLETVEQQEKEREKAAAAALAQTTRAGAAPPPPPPAEEAKKTRHGPEAAASAVPAAARQRRWQRPPPLRRDQPPAESEEGSLADEMTASFLQESLLRVPLGPEATAADGGERPSEL